jgi:hypothetical protein
VYIREGECSGEFYVCILRSGLGYKNDRNVVYTYLFFDVNTRVSLVLIFAIKIVHLDVF